MEMLSSPSTAVRRTPEEGAFLFDKKGERMDDSQQVGFQPTQKELVAFLNTQQLGRLGTLGSDGRPQVANVAFSENDELELMIGTAETSRKAQSIARDPRVAFEATDPDRRYTVQFEGTAYPLSETEFNARANKHFEKLPDSLPFKDIEGQVYFVLKPEWVRFNDCTVYPWLGTEFTFS